MEVMVLLDYAQMPDKVHITLL